jgi:hypothetical protein
LQAVGDVLGPGHLVGFFKVEDDFEIVFKTFGELIPVRHAASFVYFKF